MGLWVERRGLCCRQWLRRPAIICSLLLVTTDDGRFICWQTLLSSLTSKSGSNSKQSVRWLSARQRHTKKQLCFHSKVRSETFTVQYPSYLSNCCLGTPTKQPHKKNWKPHLNALQETIPTTSPSPLPPTKLSNTITNSCIGRGRGLSWKGVGGNHLQNQPNCTEGLCAAGINKNVPFCDHSDHQTGVPLGPGCTATEKGLWRSQDSSTWGHESTDACAETT